jgi:nitrite reductase/ring-hydroxylating ferredoxin subunit/uncharacterized membrane protein
MVRVRVSDRLEKAEGLDRVVGPVQRVVQKLPPGKVKDTLHGVQVGHPLHPMLVQVPVGAFLSAGFLDALGDDGERQARHLIGLGLLASVPAALAGSADWAEQHEQQMRTGVVHAAANSVAITLYTGSLLARGRGRRGLGKALGYAGLAAVAVGGLLGGDISYRQAGGANHVEETPHLVPTGWQDLIALAELAEGKAARVMLGEVPLFALRDGEQVHVLANKCSHMSGPLSEGELTGDRDERCVTCPWHGSVFRLRDGAVVHGPATADQPAFETRVRDGILQVCLPGAG